MNVLVLLQLIKSQTKTLLGNINFSKITYPVTFLFQSERASARIKMLPAAFYHVHKGDSSLTPLFCDEFSSSIK